MSKRKKLARVPMRPLMDATGLSVAELSRRTGIDLHNLARWAREDELTIHAADRIATAVGRHVEDIWGPTFGSYTYATYQLVATSDKDALAAYATNGRPRPTGPIEGMDEADWAAIRPDNLAPFVCPCGGVWHVRRHHDNHECESK